MTQPLISDLTALPVRWQAHGTIAASPADVAALLLAVEPGRVGYDNALVLSDLPAARHGALTVVAGQTPGSFQAIGANDHIDLAVDRSIPAVAVRSWFGGIHTVEPAAGGCRVVHHIHTARPDTGVESWTRAGLAHVLRIMADRLGVEITLPTLPLHPERESR